MDLKVQWAYCCDSPSLPSVEVLSSLPKYLVVHLNRFFWKQTPDSQDHRGVNCKVLKAVKFPPILDVYEYCDDSIKALLKVQRDKKAEEILNSKKKNKVEEEEKKKKEEQPTTALTMEMEEVDEELQRALAVSLAPVEQAIPITCGPKLPPTFSGRYEACGVVSHKGRGMLFLI